MTHILIDIFLGYLALLWFISFCTEHTRHKYQRRNRHLGQPSVHCQRWSTEDANILTRRQAE